jgi:arginase family enzyme
MLVDGDHPASWAEMGRLDLADIGDFRIAHGDIQGTLAKIEEQAAPLKHLVALGGEHTVTLPLLRALASRKGAMGLVHFDGHVDTWPESFGLVWGHGSPFYHAIEEGLVDPRHMIQIRIRSPLHRDIFEVDRRQGCDNRYRGRGSRKRVASGRRAHSRGARRRTLLPQL